MKKLITRYIGISVLFCLFLSNNAGCKKFVDVGGPVTNINHDNVYSNDATAAAVLTGIYTIMSMQNYSADLSFSTGLSSDELNLLDINQTDYYQLSTYSILQPYDNGVVNFWSRFYPLIYSANAAVEGLIASNSLTSAVKQQLIGEALFIRSFCYFYLVNIYGDVPLAVTTDYKTNTLLPRSTKADVYQQIITDLKEAANLLSSNYVGGDALSSGASVERVRPTKWVAQALLARACLYTKDYPNAERYATEVLNNTDIFGLETLDKTFLRMSRETIWALQVVEHDNGYFANTSEGREYVLSARAATGSAFTFALSNGFVQQFEPGDQRATHWISTYSNGTNTLYYPYKYTVGVGVSQSTEYPVLFRLGELYLIRAEARIQLGKRSEGIADLNVLRTRATDFTVNPVSRLSQLPLDVDKSQALHMLEYERMAELFTEMGHRWFDLKRNPGFTNSSTTRADEVMSAVKGSTWRSWAQLYPIPLIELQRAPNLTGHQNPGYQQ